MDFLAMKPLQNALKKVTLLIVKIMRCFPQYTLRDVLNPSIQEINILGHMTLILQKEEIEKLKAMSGGG